MVGESVKFVGEIGIMGGLDREHNGETSMYCI